jgi:sec-independent protein translocase protein TatA
MFGSLGMGELLVIGVILAVLFGPSQLPKLGRSLGETIREFRNIGKEIER